MPSPSQGPSSLALDILVARLHLCLLGALRPREVRWLKPMPAKVERSKACRQQSIEYSDEEGSRQVAGNLNPPSDSNFTKSCRASLWPFRSVFCFPSGSTSRASQWRYRRQREYPQPPPPSKSSTKITINKVSISSPLFRLSILNSVRALFVPDLPMRRKAVFPIAS